MRVYLSSYRFGDAVGRLTDLVGSGARVALVSNALDAIPDAARRAYAQRVHDPGRELADMGLAPFDLDLRDFFDRAGDLETALDGTDLVWAVGGNSFLLRRAMAQSGLDAILARRLGEDSLAYGGWSAGACVAGASLRGIDLMDDPAELPPRYDPVPIYTGLGLVDFVIVPHFESEHPEAADAATATAWLAANGVPYRTLRDGEALVMRNGRLELA